jgi:hypothetical protein
VADSTNSRISKYSSVTGAFIGWIGKIDSVPTGGATGCSNASSGTFIPGWCTGGTGPAGNSDGMMARPNLVYVDSNNFLNIGDGNNGSNSRVSKYDNTTGAFIGWLGKIATSPTGGGTGCAGAAIGSFTPRWCTGGTAASGVLGTMFNAPVGIYVDTSGSLYVADVNKYRLNKFNASTGVFVGWIGKIKTSPSGGPAACIGAAVGSFTPGWCLGGAADFGYGNGFLPYASGVYGDSSGNIYVASGIDGRISRYLASSGAFSGWIGTVSSTPTGGDSGCTTAALGTIIPGWCIGGSTQEGAGNGMLSDPQQIVIDSDGFMFVADSGNNRISKFVVATGAPLGALQTASEVTAFSLVPGYPTFGVGDGMEYGPRGIAAGNSDNHGYLYVADFSNGRISRYESSSGAFKG